MHLHLLPGTFCALALAGATSAQTIVQSWPVLGGSSAAFVGGVAYDSTFDEIWTLDETNDIIARYTRTGTLIVSFTPPTVTGIATPQPIGGTVDPTTGNLWVVDEAEVVYEMTRAGVWTGVAWSTTPAITDASAIAFDPLTSHVFVANDSGHVIQEYDLTGTPIGAAVSISGAGSVDSDGLEYDYIANTFYLGEDTGDQLIEVTRTGALVRTIPMNAVAPGGTLISPEGLAFDFINGSLFIGDGLSSRQVFEISGIINPATGLHANFTADVTSGPSPLMVNFTDTSFTDDAGGVLTWAWDFNGDNIPDDFTQNPSHVYTTCGDFTVSLTVTDASNPTDTITKTSFISTDDITASFTAALFVPPNIYQLTDTSTPPATAWAWDTDGDNVPDDFSQNPVVFLPQCNPTTVTLTATRNCKSDSASQTIFSSPNSLTTVFAQNNGLSSGAMVYSDYSVLNPLGIDICAFGINSGTATVGTNFTYDVYVTEDTRVGKEQNAAAWRLAGSGAGSAAGNNVPSDAPLNAPIHLPVGNYGVGVVLTGIAVRYTGSSTTTPLVVSDANLQITTGASQGTPFSGTPISVRQWNGTVYYATCSDTGAASYGFMGSGCGGTLPVGGQIVNNPPVQGGNLDLTFTNLPFDLTIVLMGFSNTFSTPFGVPLPFDGTIIGATGCKLRVGHDASLTFFIIGAPASQTASLALTIPTDPVFQCLPIYTQAATPDPAGNAFGWVLSDAAGGIIGS